jgi:uncharacterized protein (TIGR04255 family)
VGKKMGNAPVYFTVAQVRHNPVLALDSYLPAIQERFRKSGYPDFRPGQQWTFNVGAPIVAEGSSFQPPPSQVVPQYFFLNVEATSGYVLNANALAFQTVEYETYERFSGELLKGLEILHECVGGLSFVERLGLRYLDAVVPRPGEGLTAYIESSMLGLPARMPNQHFSYTFSEALLVVEGVGQVVARTISQNAPLVLPPDLQSPFLLISERFRNVIGEHAVIDTDGSVTARKPFDLKQIEGSMSAVHDLILQCFEAVATNHARAVWKAQRS